MHVINSALCLLLSACVLGSLQTGPLATSHPESIPLAQEVVIGERSDTNSVSNEVDTNQKSPRIGTVTVFIAGILAGYLVDGVLIYYTGYSGGQLCAQGLQALENLTAKNSQITQAYFNSVNSNYVDVYTTSTGNECVRTVGLTYACKYSVE